MNPLIAICHLHVHFHTYEGIIQAVRGLNFYVNRGEIIGLVGESGSGKSVTAQAILQLLPKDGHIASGRILFEGEDLVVKRKQEIENIRGKKIGMIFQDPFSSLNPTMRIGQQILEVLVKHEGFSRKAAYQKALQLLDQVGIGDAVQRMHQYPHELSGGMRQRILLAIAIACRPSFIIADEPTTALDVTTQAQILELIKAIRKQQQTSFLLITHDLGVVAHLCDRVLVIYGGQIVETAPVDQLFSNPQHPYTQALLKSKRSLTMPKQGGELFVIPGNPPSLLQPPSRCSFLPRCPYAMNICQQREPFLEPKGQTQQVACWLSS